MANEIESTTPDKTDNLDATEIELVNKFNEIARTPPMYQRKFTKLPFAQDCLLQWNTPLVSTSFPKIFIPWLRIINTI